MNYEIILERMRKVMNEKGIQLSDLEKATGLKRDRIKRLLSGKGLMKVSEFVSLCTGLGVSADELLRTDGR